MLNVRQLAHRLVDDAFLTRSDVGATSGPALNAPGRRWSLPMMLLKVETGSGRIFLRLASNDARRDRRVRQVPLIARAFVLWIL